MRIDSHQHFWKYDPVKDAWITNEMMALQSDFLPADIAPLLSQHDFDGCVAVQADPSENETNFLVEIASNNRFIKGVVGWIDFQSESIGEKLSQVATYPIVKGFRHIVQVESTGFMLGKKFLRGLSHLNTFNFTYDLLINEAQLQDAILLAKKIPYQKFVLDHLGKPTIKTKHIESWKSNVRELGQLENVHCKLSGLVTEADWLNWNLDDFTPYLDAVVESFGTKRLIYGSDWPVCLLAASYQSQLGIIEHYFKAFTDTEKEAIFGNNAVRFYNL
jgi:L-fuconolactonase